MFVNLRMKVIKTMYWWLITDDWLLITDKNKYHMAENQTQSVPAKSKRDLFGERLKKKYPDRDYADDEALFGQINDDYDQYDN